MKKSYLKNIIFFIILILLTFFFLVRGQNLNYMFRTVAHVRWEYTFIGILLMSIYFIIQSYDIILILKNFGYKIKFFNAIRYVAVEYFYSALTPSSTGGQPMQIYQMSKEGINISHCTIMVLLELCSYQIVALIYMIIGLIINYKYLNSNLDFFKVLLIYGIVVTTIYITLLLIVLFSKKATTLIKKVISFILKKIKYKNYDKVMNTIEEETGKYHDCAAYIKEHKDLLFKIIGMNFIRILASYSVTYITCRAFHLHVPYYRVVSLQAVLYTCVAAIPIPGTIGINEVGFGQIFLPVFTEELISLATVLNRFMNFYFFVIITGIISVVSHVKPGKQKKLENTDNIKQIK